MTEIASRLKFNKYGFFINEPNHGYKGCLIEFVAPAILELQEAQMDVMRPLGYACFLVEEADEVLKIITDYLGAKDD